MGDLERQADGAGLTAAGAAPPLQEGRRRRRLALALGASLFLAACAGWQALGPPGERTLGESSALGLDLARPDALIESESLARLPRDLLQVPLLRDTLSEDFVYYYEGANADRLGIAGALRRIAYEHQLGLRDALIEDLLAQPAELALWRSADGKLGHAALLIRQNRLLELLQPLARIAADDKQLSKVGELHVAGEGVPVFRLRYNGSRAVLFAGYRKQLLVLASPELLQGEAADSALGRLQAGQLEALLAQGSPWPDRFKLDRRSARHRLTLSADYLALGYGRFVPQLAGLSFEQRGKGWRAALALHPGTADSLQFAPLWQAMPMGASACAAVPVAHSALQPLFERLAEAEALDPALAARLDGPVALCWYGGSRLHTPLLVTRLGGEPPDADVDNQLAQAFERMVGAHEGNAPDGGIAVEIKDFDSANPSKARPPWTRVVGSSFGLYPADTLEQPDWLEHSHYFRVALARHDRTLLFSLDDSLVEQAIATLDQRYPALAEQLPRSGAVPAYLAADGLAALLEKETLASLPSDLEPIFRNAAESHLLPRLRALGGHRRYALALPADAAARVRSEWTWLPLQWSAL